MDTASTRRPTKGVGQWGSTWYATALSLLINSSGAVSVNLVPLMTPEDVDQALTKSPTYRAPGT